MPLSPELAQAYLRAAVALENGRIDGEVAKAAVARAPALIAYEVGYWDVHDPKPRAARLLRECVATGEPLK